MAGEGMAGEGAYSTQDVSSLFHSFWLHPQILPNGFHVVTNLASPKTLNAPRPLGARPSTPFSVLGALQDPKRFADASQAEGYATVTLNLTKGIAEVYHRAEEEADSPPALRPSQQTPPCCGPGFEGSLPLSMTPPFFPMFRAFVNDRAIYQSRLLGLGAPLNPSASDVQILGEESVEWAATPTTVAASPASCLNLHGVYELKWNEEVQFFVYSPTAVITLQMFEKDFCPDLALSESLLTSISVPVAPLVPNQPVDIIINVFCTLPQAYSLESLVPPPPSNPKMKGEVPPVICPPTTIVCKVHVSVCLNLDITSMNAPLREMAALSLPRGPWTAQALVDSVHGEDQLSVITGSDILSVTKSTGPLSVFAIFSAFSTLLFSLTAGLDDLGNEEVIIALRDSVTLEEDKKAASMVYVDMADDLTLLARYLIVGPLERLTKFISEVTHFQRPLAAVIIVLVCWLPFVLSYRYLLIFNVAMGLFALFCLSEIHVPYEPKSKGTMHRLVDTLKTLQGAQMVVRPVEKALMQPRTLRRVRILQLWLKAMRRRVSESESAQATGFLAALFQFARSPLRICLFSLLFYYRKLRALVSVVLAILITLLFCRQLSFATAFFGVLRAIPQYYKLQGVRRSVSKMITQGQAPFGKLKTAS